jgi:Bacterial capsule synthesis protein PGA_cap
MVPYPILSFVGDMSISWRQWPEFVANHSRWLEGDVAGCLAASTAVIGNLECVPLPVTYPAIGQTFSTVPAAALDYFAALHVRCLTLANNHIMDAGVQGLEAVIAEIEARNMQYFGAGLTADVAEAPLILQLGDQKVALLGACDASYAWATQRNAGVAPLQANRVMARLLNIRDHVDRVIFVFHAGAEFRTMAEYPRVKLCRALAEAGASAIFQHHPHVVQPYEIWNGVPICYSLGNFCFEIDGNRYMEQRQHVRDGLIAHLSLDPEVTLIFDSIAIDTHGRPSLVKNTQEIDDILKQGALILANPAALKTAWKKCADSESAMFLGDAYWALRRGGPLAGYKSLKHSLRQPRLRDCLLSTISRGFF